MTVIAETEECCIDCGSPSEMVLCPPCAVKRAYEDAARIAEVYDGPCGTAPEEIASAIRALKVIKQ